MTNRPNYNSNVDNSEVIIKKFKKKVAKEKIIENWKLHRYFMTKSEKREMKRRFNQWK